MLNQEYNEFLLSKQLTAPAQGFEVSRDELNSDLFEWQKDAVAGALEIGRAALFEECGLGKTRQLLDWSKLVSEHTRGRVLIATPLAVAHQTIAEGKKVGLDVFYARSQAQSDASLKYLTITNYDMLKHFDPKKFAGVVLDEADILQSFMGKTKQLIIEMFKDTRYKLECTATPSPNDYLELGNHAEFLNIMPSNEMIARWFINNTMKAGAYRLKQHAEKDFWRWVTSWAVCISKPSDIGYSDAGFELPPLNLHEYRIEVDHSRAWEKGELFLDGSQSATSMWAEKHATLNDRCAKAFEIVSQSEDKTAAWVIWCDTDEESKLLYKLLLPVVAGDKTQIVEVKGSDSIADKEKKLSAFSDGEARIIITKPQIAGFGLNWQHCHNMCFVGVTYSFKKFYQALRRSYRFRQTMPVEAHLIYAESEGDIMKALHQKQKAHEGMQAAMNAAMQEYGLFNSNARRELERYHPTVRVQLPDWLISKAG